MIYHPGSSVKELLSTGKLTQEDKSKIIALALSKVTLLHSRGWIHRNLKADNILVAPDLSDVWLFDYALAEPLGDDAEKSELMKRIDVERIWFEIQKYGQISP